MSRVKGVVAALALAAAGPAGALEIIALARDGTIQWQDLGSYLYTLEISDDLTSWRVVQPFGRWPIEAPAWRANEGLGWPAGRGFYRVRAEPTPATPPGMVRIPAGTFSMGDPLGDCYTETPWPYDELPLHPVALGSFCMDETEVTKALWDEVYSWAVTNGYSFDNPGSAKGPAYPVHDISWYDAVKWCNARSEKEGLTPCYCRSVAQITVYRNGQVDIENDWVRWSANGYRLPTEAQWEYAARGGAVGRRFPWSDVDTVTHSRANYCSTPELPYDVSPTRGYHPDYQTGGFGYTSPARSFSANGYGVYDLAGNVEEWCWDAYDAGYYGVSPPAFPMGPNVGGYRVVRGGSSEGLAFLMRCAKRWNWSAFVALSDLGLRCVR